VTNLALTASILKFQQANNSQLAQVAKNFNIKLSVLIIGVKKSRGAKNCAAPWWINLREKWLSAFNPE
jgi:hypothetical protein